MKGKLHETRIKAVSTRGSIFFIVNPHKKRWSSLSTTIIYRTSIFCNQEDQASAMFAQGRSQSLVLPHVWQVIRVKATSLRRDQGADIAHDDVPDLIQFFAAGAFTIPTGKGAKRFTKF
jgi:virulence-associated protein VagC